MKGPERQPRRVLVKPWSFNRTDRRVFLLHPSFYQPKKGLFLDTSLEVLPCHNIGELSYVRIFMVIAERLYA